MRKKEYRKYSKSFKLEALRLLESSEKPAAEIERDLGITPGLLGKWKTRYKIDQESGKLASNELQAARREIRRLERELEIAQQERDILKKRSASSRRKKRIDL